MSEQEGQEIPKTEEQADKYKNLKDNLDSLTEKLDKRLIARKQKKIKQREELNDLLDSIEESSNVVVSKIQDLNRKPTIIITVSKILPQIPENFPKNYNVQITYEDVVVTGNQKFTDFDENNIDDKLVLPLLSSENARLQIWTAEQQPSIFDKAVISLENDIQAVLHDSNYEAQINLQSNPDISVAYSMQLHGVGFSAWIKNLKSIKQAEEQRSLAIQQAKSKEEKNRKKVEEKKQKFNDKFGRFEQRTTREYKMEGIDDILGNLDSD